MANADRANVWLRMARFPAVADSLRALADHVAAEVDRTRPRCDLSGRCCNFEAYGHRMYLTGLEVAYAAVLHRRSPAEPSLNDPSPPTAPASRSLPILRPAAPAVLVPLSPASLADALARGGCPFQVGLRCGIHAIRPLPCRVYFCDPAAQAWQHDLTERLLRQIRALHDQHDIPYVYAEWRSLLAEVLAAEG
ncbi:MAG: hypothetical protein JNM80_12455 [Phycisphaerae bacterium]|nr:hypothetical protein [Phycisphaerae bacterium]